MAFCGGEGLVTSKHTATFIMVCQKVHSQPSIAWAITEISSACSEDAFVGHPLESCLQSVAVCGDCFEVAGPANSSVALYDYGANSTSTFQLQLEWDPAYLGPLSVDVLPPVR